MKNNPIFKPAIIIIAILLVIGGVYSFFGDNFLNTKENDNDSDSQVKIESSGLDQDQEVETVEEVEEVIAKWIENNPQAILESVANMQKKAIEEQTKKAQKTIKSKKDKIFDDRAPAYKPKGYDVTIVEFFDYNCGYCKKVNETIENLIQDDKKVRIIYRDFPILGQSSEELSKVSIAVDVVDTKKFRAFHNKLMASDASSQADALRIAKEVGVNVDKVKKVLSSKKDRINEIINENRQLGSSIGIQGTPAFVIGEELIPGAVGIAALKAKIIEQRQ